MAGFDLSEWISRPPKEVFDFITSSDNAPKVVQSVKSMVKLTEGPVRVGTRYRETRLMSWQGTTCRAGSGCIRTESEVRHEKRDRGDRNGLSV